MNASQKIAYDWKDMIIYDGVNKTWCFYLTSCNIPRWCFKKEAEIYLKQLGIKGNLLRDLKDLVTKDNILSDFNKNANLLCFNNGVYDLEKHEFRRQHPGDLVSYSTNYDFEEKDNIEKENEINDLLLSLTGNETEANRILMNFAFCLRNNADKRYLILNGEGRCGKSTLISLLNICLGDYIINVGEDGYNCLFKAKMHKSIQEMKNKRVIVCNHPEDRYFYKFLNQDNNLGFTSIFQRSEVEKYNEEKVNIINLPFNFVENPLKSGTKKIDVYLKSRLMDDVGYRKQFMRMLLRHV